MDKKSLLKIPLFQDLHPECVELLAERFQEEHFDAETTIFQQDDRAERLYVLMAGQVAIRFKPHDGDWLMVTEIHEGGVFGWSAALGRRRYTSSAICLKDCHTYSIKGDELHSLCQEYPENGVIILERLAEVIAQRLQNTHSQVVEMLHQGMMITNGELDTGA
jgi:CRP-like cAMP-binding protein